MFQQIARLDADKFYFEFPIGCLPVSPPGVCMCARACVVHMQYYSYFGLFHCQLPTQLALRDGVIPPFYTEKVLMDTVLDNVPTHVTLSILQCSFPFS